MELESLRVDVGGLLTDISEVLYTMYCETIPLLVLRRYRYRGRPEAGSTHLGADSALREPCHWTRGQGDHTVMEERKDFTRSQVLCTVRIPLQKFPVVFESLRG